MMSDYAVISPSDSAYPEALSDVLPGTRLYAIGNVDLLKKRAIGICGSREASPEALQWALKFGTEMAGHGFVVASGYARGVDRQAHKGSLQAKGATIAVLAEGVNYFRLVRELEPFVDLSRNFLAISMFEPGSVWQSWRAMERNKLIVGLSIAMVVVEARERGGTINAAMECVRQRKPLWAIAYATQHAGREGNQKLLRGSATPIRSLGDLQKALNEAEAKAPPETQQLAMNLV